MLYTECPLCQTLFRITQEMLGQANGMVRCSCCEQVFDARKQFRNPPESIEEKHEAEQGAEADTSTPSDEAEPTNPSTVDQLEELLVDLEQEIGPSSKEALTKEAPKSLNTDTDEPENVINTDQEPPDLESLLGQQQHKSRGHPVLWTLACLLSLTILLLQLAWSERLQLIEHPHGVKLLNTLCQQLGCQVPQRRDTSKIEVLSRNITSHPETPNALTLQLTIISETDYNQPYPQLQVNLFDNNNSLIASRIFSPLEYLPEEWQQTSPLMPAKREIDINMTLVDPGEAVTGFKLEFL